MALNASIGSSKGSFNAREVATRVFIVAAAYHIFAQLGLLMAIPPGFATVFWPASGVALAAVICWGTPVLAGVFIGSFTVNLYIAYKTGGDHLTLVSIFVAVGIASASSIQSSFSALLIKMFIPVKDWNFIKLKQLLGFIVLGGPVGCLVAASIGTLILTAAGFVDAEQGFYNWFTWWLGDMLGVVILGPALALLMQSGAVVSGVRKTQVIVPMALLFAILGVGYVQLEKQASKALTSQVEAVTETTYLEVQSQLINYERILLSLGSFYRSSKFVDDKEFASFSKPLISSEPSLLALEWVPRVNASDVDRHIENARENGLKGYSIKSVEGELADGSQRWHYPIRYVYPLDGNEFVLGMDLWSNSIRREALFSALSTGNPAATEAVDLVREGSDRGKGVLLVAPENIGRNENIILAVFEIAPLFRHTQRSLRGTPLGIAVTDAITGGQIFGHALENSIDNTISSKRVIKSVSIGQRTWLMEFFPSQGLVQKEMYSYMSPVLFAAVAFLALISVFILSTTANALALEQEIRTKASHISEDKVLFEKIFDHVNAHIEIRSGVGKRLLKVNRSAQSFWGISASDQGFDSVIRWPETSKEKIKGSENKAVSTGEVVSILHENIDSELGEYCFDIKKIPVLGKDGLPRYLVTVLEDVTAEDESDQVLQKLLASLPLAVLIVNRHGRIEFSNKMANEWFNLDDNLTPLSRIIPVRFHQKHNGLFKSFINNPYDHQMAADRKIYGVDKNGEEILLRIKLVSITWHGHKSVMSLLERIEESDIGR